MKPSEIKKILLEIGGGPDKKLGQHFLIDRSALFAIVKSAEIQHGDRVLEIGPGLGVLTDALRSRGADVIAIEKDKRFDHYLASVTDARIIQGDAVEMNWDEIAGEGEWKFVSNLPYSITSLALRKALWAKNPPKKVVVLIQKEVADRILVLGSHRQTVGAKKEKGSLVSLMVALSSSSVRCVRNVSRGAFYPPPKVESAIVAITPMSWEDREKKWGIHPDEIMKVAKMGFSHPRKMLKSNLALGKESKILDEIGSHEKVRAEDLTVLQWAELAKRLKKKKEIL
ncbi:MAG: 16S rRNA (adenine(1518)-N(6)/adenine(1519)-N(6))-dimethyltransferase RsmA [bacterium]|nr:16S rRNA (adenine(1518)-N(6)/adenine(1519)-N(6))-dimethyltransferase RsmA [bacterium]